jgi:hypothetical protein
MRDRSGILWIVSSMIEREENEMDEREELQAEILVFGDPRRCPRHGEVISTPDGMHDWDCGSCEREMDDAWHAEQDAAAQAADPEGYARKLATIERDAKLAAQALADERAYAAEHPDEVIF